MPLIDRWLRAENVKKENNNTSNTNCISNSAVAVALVLCCSRVADVAPKADARRNVEIAVDGAQELPIKSGVAWICLRDFCQWPDTNNTFSFIAE